LIARITLKALVEMKNNIILFH